MTQQKIKKLKSKLREEIKKQFLNFSIQELNNKSIVISKQIENYVDNNKIDTILCYYPIKYEVNILKSMEKWLKVGKKILLPRLIGGKIDVFELKSLENLVLGKFGIPEPDSLNPYVGKIDLAIVPGLIFSREGIRIGKGFGFYDKYFEENKKIIKLGIAYSFQIRENLEKERFDVNMDDITYA